MARPRKPLLSRDRIVETAGALVDAEGLAALSTRRLAAELGVSGPSLYNHFRTKDEILDAVADAVSAKIDLSMFAEDDGRDWQTALHDWAVSYRAALADHPHIVPVLAQGPGRRPAGLRVADAVFGAMVRAGWPPAQATSIGALMRYFITGSALGSFARGFVDDEAAYDPADYPHLGQAHRLAEHRQKVDEGAFATGLRALLDGLRLQYETQVRASAARGVTRAGSSAPHTARGESATPHAVSSESSARGESAARPSPAQDGSATAEG